MKVEQEQKKLVEKIKYIKFLIIEGILLAIAVGLLVNQITNFIPNNSSTTWKAVLILIVIIIGFALIVYIGKLEEIYDRIFQKSK